MKIGLGLGKKLKILISHEKSLVWQNIIKQNINNVNIYYSVKIINLVIFKEKLTLLSLFIMDKDLYNYYTSLSEIHDLFSRPKLIFLAKTVIFEENFVLKIILQNTSALTDYVSNLYHTSTNTYYDRKIL